MTARHDEIHAALADRLDFVPTDDEIGQVLAEQPHIQALADEWGWGDSQVRTELARELEWIRAWPAELEWRQEQEREAAVFFARPRWQRQLIRFGWRLRRWLRR